MSYQRTAYILVFLLLGSTSIFGQATISGVVKDISDQPIPGANVYLAGSYDGTSSRTDGTFSFSTSLEGAQVLLASFIGYEDYSDSVHLSDLHAFSIVLKEEISQMDGVVITAGSFEASDEVKGQVLKPLDIVTTAGATADIAGALNTLPGTQTVGEEGRLFVRGGDAYETTTFIDGILVVDSYNRSAPNVPTRNRFSPMMFKGTSFSTGGYSAEHGQGLSSALILKTKDVASQNRSDISLMSVGLEGAHTQIFDRSSFSGKIGYINLGPYFRVVPQSIDYTSPPSVLDGNLSYQLELSKGGYFKFYSKFNISDMALNYVPVDSTEDLSYSIKNNFGYVGTSYKKILNDRWTIDAGLGYTRSKDRIAPETDTIEELQQALHSKVGFGVDVSNSLFIKFGTELFNFDHYQDYKSSDGFSNHFSVSPIISATYLEAELNLTRKFLLRAGGRMEYYSLDGVSIDPRISAAYQIGKNGQFSVAYGKFRQAPPQEFSRVANELTPEKATHYIGSYQWSKKNRVFRLEGYWKDYDQLVKFTPDMPFDPLSYTNEGFGHARGVDLFWRDGASIPNSDFWLSYSFLDTQRDYKDYPNAVAPSFTSKHNISLVYKYFISAWRTQIGATYSFASGRPYNDPNEQRFMAQHTPAYNDLSLNVSYLVKSNMILYVSATNVLGAENIFGYEYTSNPDQTGRYPGRPVTLPARRFLFVGFFITLSKENTLNQLPNL